MSTFTDIYVKKNRFWSGLAVFSALAVIGSFFIPLESMLPESAEPYFEQLMQGVYLVRWVGIAMLVLSLFCLKFWSPAPTPAVGPPIKAYGWGFTVLTFIVAALVRSPNLNASFWWDELTTVLRYVHRGIPVIMTFSGECNNHVMTSLLAFFSFGLWGEGEWQMRLPMFLLAAATPTLVFRKLSGLAGRPSAWWCTLLIICHSSLIVVATEGRGYSGAVFCTVLCCFLFAEIMTRNSRGLMLSYVLCCAAGYGFLVHFLLVPVSHGIIAGLLWLLEFKKDRKQIFSTPAFSVMITCLWSGLLALAVFGIQLPQAFAYLHSAGAQRDHFPVSLSLYADVINYVSGAPVLGVSVLAFTIALLGWLRAPLNRLLKWGFLAPLLLIAVWTVIPGQRFSPRLFIILTPVIMMGCGLFFASWERKGKLGAVISGVLLCGWLLAQAPVLKQHIQIGYPNTRGLAERLEGSRVTLYGQMADVNAYYFDYGTVYRFRPESEAEWTAFFDADYIVRGTNPEKPLDKDLVNAGWEVQETLMSWRPRHPCFRVWVKAASSDPVSR